MSAAGLPRPHDIDVEAREHFATRIERLRQRLAAAHVVANPLQQDRDRRRGGEADQDLERTIERQSRLQQRREFACQREELVAADGRRLEETPPPRAGPRQRRRRDTRRPGGVRDLHRHQPLVAQAIDDLAFVRRVEFTDGDFARGTHCAVAVERHQLPFTGDAETPRKLVLFSAPRRLFVNGLSACRARLSQETQRHRGNSCSSLRLGVSL